MAARLTGWERLVVWLPKPMKAALLELRDADGRRWSEFIRALFGEAIARKRNQQKHPQQHHD